jgi:hypothetical protein
MARCPDRRAADTRPWATPQPRERRRTLGSSGAGKISRSTVKTHLQSVYHKLGVASRSEAIERAIDLRLL